MPKHCTFTTIVKLHLLVVHFQSACCIVRLVYSSSGTFWRNSESVARRLAYLLLPIREHLFYWWFNSSTVQHQFNSTSAVQTPVKTNIITSAHHHHTSRYSYPSYLTKYNTLASWTALHVRDEYTINNVSSIRGSVFRAATTTAHRSAPANSILCHT